MTSALNSCIVGIFDMTDRHILHGKKCPLELALAIQWNEAVFPPILCYQWFFVICAQRESFSTSNTFSSSFPFCVLLIKTRSDKRQTTKVHGSSDVDGHMTDLYIRIVFYYFQTSRHWSSHWNVLSIRIVAYIVPASDHMLYYSLFFDFWIKKKCRPIQVFTYGLPKDTNISFKVRFQIDVIWMAHKLII